MPDKETRYYRFGGLLVRLDGPAFRETDYLAPFRATEGVPDLHFTVEPADDIAPPLQAPRHRALYDAFYDAVHVVYSESGEGILLKDTDLGGGRHSVQLDRAYWAQYGSHLVLRLLDLPRRMLEHGGVFLHASYIVTHGGAILFTAPKQTGKSTQAALWEAHRGAEIINGDRALVRKIGGTWCACGSPYCGTSKICRNATAPVKAIVMLGRSAENRIRYAAPREAVAAFLDGCTYDTWDRQQVDTVLTLAQQIMEQVPVIRLDCLPDESAVRALEEFL